MYNILSIFCLQEKIEEAASWKQKEESYIPKYINQILYGTNEIESLTKDNISDSSTNLADEKDSKPINSPVKLESIDGGADEKCKELVSNYPREPLQVFQQVSTKEIIKEPVMKKFKPIVSTDCSGYNSPRDDNNTKILEISKQNLNVPVNDFTMQTTDNPLQSREDNGKDCVDQSQILNNKIFGATQRDNNTREQRHDTINPFTEKLIGTCNSKSFQDCIDFTHAKNYTCLNIPRLLCNSSSEEPISELFTNDQKESPSLQYPTPKSFSQDELQHSGNSTTESECCNADIPSTGLPGPSATTESVTVDSGETINSTEESWNPYSQYDIPILLRTRLMAEISVHSHQSKLAQENSKRAKEIHDLKMKILKIKYEYTIKKYGSN